MADRYDEMDPLALGRECRDYEINGHSAMTPDQMRAALRKADAETDTSAEDDFEAGMAQELANRAEAKRQAEGFIDDSTHPMLAGKTTTTPDGQPKKARAPSGSSNGLKIEQNRETRNGVTRPSIGGKCRGIWDMLDAMGTAATAKEAREAGAGKFDKTTIMVQFYRWRKFNGIEGRQS